MIRLLHTADWHLGAPRAHPVLVSKTIPAILKAANKFSCSNILVVGDVFDKPKPDQQVKDLLVRQILDYRNEIGIIFSVGNHDYTTKAKNYHSLKNLFHLREASGNKLAVHVIEPGGTLESDEFIIKALVSLDERSKIKTKKPVVLVWHGTPPGLKIAGNNITIEDNRQIAEAIDYYEAEYFALGDIHRPMKLHDRCWYSGPPVQKMYTDKDSVLIVTLDNFSVEKYRLPLPKKISIEVESDSDIVTEDQIIKFVHGAVERGNLIKIKMELPSASWVMLDRERIREELQADYLEVVLENSPITVKTKRAATAQIASAKTVEEEMHAVIKAENFNVNKTKLLETCRRYIRD